MVLVLSLLVLDPLFLPFLARLDEVQEEYCTTTGVGVCGGVDISRMLKFYVKVFYEMARPCQASYPVPVTGLVC